MYFKLFYLHKQPSKLARSHGIYFATRVYTPGYPARPHPTPQDTIPSDEINRMKICYKRNVRTVLISTVLLHTNNFEFLFIVDQKWPAAIPLA